MKPTGIVREVDPLGRVVIPMELRKIYNISVKTPMEIFLEGEKIILQKYERHDACIVTGDVSKKNMTLANGTIVLSQKGADELTAALEAFLNKQYA
ncbi:AbrB/MazE/SpoVT family DNA-binding domain-containing protein [Bacillus sp. F19]|nr:AbrB/MazE/SpoVT family DNA-binding domain-containing protein [Bacillus sp. F19]